MGRVTIRRPSDAHRGDGHEMRLEDGVGLLLIPVGAEGLLEVPHPVKQPDASEGQIERAGGLEVVPGQYPEPPGILRQDFGNTELRTEICNRFQRRLAPELEPAG